MLEQTFTSKAAWNVMLVDDDDDSRFLSRTLLHSTGVRTFSEASDGKQAIKAAARTHPDLILLDLQMPGMDGWTALPHLRKANPKARIVVLSGMEPDEVRLGRLGANGFISKDSGNDRFLSEVNRFMTS